MDQSLQLLNYCLEITAIQCSSCRKQDSADADAMESIDEFYRMGWRVRKGSCYCPTCSADLGLLLPKKTGALSRSAGHPGRMNK